MIREFYKDKTILMTGCTGFVGKVVLEKFIRSVPDFKMIYVLVRPKRGTKPMDRVWKDIFSSQCFDVVRKKPNFMEIVNTRIKPIEGDITKDLLAIKPEDRIKLVNELNVIINIAASVDFNERICDAL
jgi:fatty acyl-CoA reductase